MTPLEMLRAAAELAYPSRFAEGLRITPDPWQAQLLDSAARHRIVCCSRQVGKSTTTSILVAQTGATTADGLILITAPTERQSKELLIKSKRAISEKGVEIATDNATEVVFSNGTRLFALPGSEKSIRGFSAVTLLVVDEAARVPDALWHAVAPMVAVSRGTTVLLSTPFGQRGFFYSLWTKGGDEWERYRVTAFECPRIPRDWLEAERRRIGDWAFRQEYLAEFLEPERSAFSLERVRRAVSDEIAPLFGADNRVPVAEGVEALRWDTV